MKTTELTSAQHNALSELDSIWAQFRRMIVSEGATFRAVAQTGEEGPRTLALEVTPAPKPEPEKTEG